MNKLKWKMQQFLQGRNGADQLSQTSVIVGLVFYFIYIFTRKGMFNWISTIALIYALFRVLSKNLSARADENRLFMRQVQLVKTKWELRKTHKVFMCKKCGKIIRVPKGKGKIEVTCPSCREKKIIQS